jgi:hypothetical protein
VFGNDADLFVPERWLEGKEVSSGREAYFLSVSDSNRRYKFRANTDIGPGSSDKEQGHALERTSACLKSRRRSHNLPDTSTLKWKTRASGLLQLIGLLNQRTLNVVSDGGLCRRLWIYHV